MIFFRIAVCIFLAASCFNAPSVYAGKHKNHRHNHSYHANRSPQYANRARYNQHLRMLKHRAYSKRHKLASANRYAVTHNFLAENNEIIDLNPINKSQSDIYPNSVLAASSALLTTTQNKNSAAVSGPINRSLSAELDRIIYQNNDGCNVGVHVKSMRSGDVLYAHNVNMSFTPASTLKVLTAEAGLLFLGSQYRFPTRILTDAKAVDHGVLNGNLYLVQTGDPSLTYRDLEALMADLKAQQIQLVTGNVYIDNTAYDKINYGPGWMWDDKRYCFAAPINASIINHNCLSFKMSPGAKPGRIANILANPAFSSTIENNVITKPSSYRSCFIHLTDATTSQSSAIAVTGCMPKGSYTQHISTVINNITQYNLALVRNLFSSAGIEIQGSVVEGRAGSNLLMVSEHYSKPLNKLVIKMLKMSDNIIAGSVFKKIGELYSGRPGSWENGSLAVKQILAKKIGLNTGGMNVTDGSGLSEYNAISPAQMMQVLDFAFHDHSTNYDFISALPIAGVDGTLKMRLQNVAGKIRAKTGTLKGSGVVSLAGYVVNRNKEPLAFVIMINGRKGLAWKYKELEDRIVTTLARFSR